MRVYKNLVRQEATPTQKDYTKQIIPYGNNDNFPLRLARLVQNSPTASSCIDTKVDFIEGSGFSDPNLSDKIINGRGERFGDIHALNSDAFGTFEGFAINVKYNSEGKPSELYSVPFEYCRFGIPDTYGVIGQIHVNPHFGDGEWRETDTEIYDSYNPDPEVVLLQQARDTSPDNGKCIYKGQILYVGTTGPLSRFYPAPKYYSCKNWMAIDEAISGFHKHNIDNGFFQSVLFKMIGEENAPSTHPDDQKWDDATNQYVPIPGRTLGYRFNIEMQKFTGWEKAGNVMVLWAAMKEAMPELQAFPATTNSELFKTLSDLTTEQIARATKVPAILANISSGASLGGDGNIIRASVKLMQQRVIKTHAMFERVYKGLLSKMAEPFNGDVKILHYNPFPELEKIDPLIWAALSLPEQRKWIKKNTEFELVEAEPATTPAPTVTNKFSNISYSNYPEKAKQLAKKAKDFREKTGSNCGGKGGREMTDDIIAGKPLSFKAIKRIYNFLNKNQVHKSKVFSDSCEAVLYQGWGGDEMLNWAQNIISSIND